MGITLEGLNKQQYQIADLLWQCDTQEQMQHLIEHMPPEYARDARVIHQLMIAAVMDQYTEVSEDVQDLISRICS